MIGPLRAVVLDAPDHRGLQRVADYRAPGWGDPARPQQLHLEARCPDLNAAEPAVLALGAARLPGEGGNWRVYADPAGHPFCLVVPA